MKTSTTVSIIALIIIVLGGWWWWSQSNYSPAPAPAVGTNPAISNTVALGTGATSTVGVYLTGSNGMTLYTFDKDGAGTTTCYTQCAKLWPPYVIAPNTAVTAPAGATGRTGTIERADGGQQVTYNGAPLYFYSKDQAPNDVTGDGVQGVWHVVKP